MTFFHYTINHWKRAIALFLIGMVVGAWCYQRATIDAVIVRQLDRMVGTARPGETLELEVRRAMAGPCKHFVVMRTLWRWKDKTKTSVAAGGERELAPFVFSGDASPFADDTKFQLDLSLENVPRQDNPNAGPWNYYTTLTPACPFWVYPPSTWFDRPVVYESTNAPVHMTRPGDEAKTP